MGVIVDDACNCVLRCCCIGLYGKLGELDIEDFLIDSKLFDQNEILGGQYLLCSVSVWDVRLCLVGFKDIILLVY